MRCVSGTTVDFTHTHPIPFRPRDQQQNIERMPTISRTISTAFDGLPVDAPITPEDSKPLQLCRVLGYLRYLSRHMVYL
jgi:hypothetical protein